MTKRVLVKRIRRKMWGGRIDVRCYSDGSAHVRVDHPSNDPVVEMGMAVGVMEVYRETFGKHGLTKPVPGVMRWRDDPEPQP